MDRWGPQGRRPPLPLDYGGRHVPHPLSSGFASLVVVGLLIGFGNGLGSGIVMTLGADFSPEIGRAQFLGAWRVCGDLGTAGGPLVVAAATGLASPRGGIGGQWA
ncbi:hypothetical protein [Candidatus Amarobacter glycogenicus]|uniref:hypothetical protein n=1 Tax=Candidatus Amarobacter glycogenicus TaxID=3140699 RepID=UPI0031CCBFC0